tara:strand:- start:234 stop:368 length:135 start_codon:yes stop_codon:yes gene_type:complete
MIEKLAWLTAIIGIIALFAIFPWLLLIVLIIGAGSLAAAASDSY